MATSLSRREPTQDISTARQMMDKFVNDAMFAGASRPHRVPQSHDFGQNVAVDVIERETCFIVSASVPGVKAEDIEVVIIDNVLTVKGECKPDPTADEDTYHLRERLRGQFSRCIVFPSAINAARMKITHKNGVVTLVLPKCGNARPTAGDVQPSLIQNGHSDQPRALT